MTTRTTPPRTTLPPHLTRHFYETRRAFLRQVTGEESTPWFALTALERAVVESEMTLFREAIRRAEEEQDLLASLDAAAGTAPAAEDTDEEEDASDENAPEDCSCPGCSAVAAFIALLEQTGKKLEASVRPSATNPNGFPFSVGEVTSVVFEPAGTVPPLPEDTERLRQLAKDAIDEWVAAGKPLEAVTDPAALGNAIWTIDITPAWLTVPTGLDDDPAQRQHEERTLRYFRQGWLRPFPPKV
ncbi:hypothetical protein [Streptomyces glaucus]